MFYLFAALSFSRLSCKNGANKNVDWFSTFKIPAINDRNPNHATGLAFFYIDETTRLMESNGDMGSKNNNPVYYSMAPMYTSTSKVGYVLISDQPPEGTTPASRAHMKGVMIFDEDNGIYIEHSTPKFPPDPNSDDYSYPSTGTKYGQSLLCVTLSHSGLESVAQGLLIDRPGVYASSLPVYTKDIIPSLSSVISQDWNREDETMQRTIQVGSVSFEFFAKSGSWNQDLYHDLLAPSLKARSFSQTWSNGVGTLTSDCTGKYSSFNVLKMTFDGVEWPRSKDHSKWAVIGDYVCISGINRQASQFKRGGGAWCKKDATWARSMTRVVGEYEQCP